MRRNPWVVPVCRAVATAVILTPVLAAVVAVGPAAAAGAPDCNSAVVDSAHVLGPATRSRAALQKFTADSDGATVYVRTYSSLPESDPDAQAQLLERSCPTWRDAQGVRSEALVLIIVDTGDRKTGLFYGEKWTDQLGPVYQSIEADSMNPLFARHQFDAGVAAGLTAIAADIDAAVPSSGPQGATAISDSLSVGWAVWAIFAAAIAFIVFVFAAVGIRLSRMARGGRAVMPGGDQDPTAHAYLSGPGSGHHHHHHGGSHGGFSGGGGFGGGDGGGGGGSSSW